MMGWFGWERISRERRRLVQLSEIIGEPSDSFLSSPQENEQEKGGSFALQAEKKRPTHQEKMRRPSLRVIL
jgi:hypothetical protein